ncbi:hypothetical protein GCM10012275_62710 [Longimycelium tulufanense]|uniref:GGDEF domain-containing protein n=1 Tax=Longimycelium tulufanense TaxID=907463 RepID=A0A8J3CJ02_9PSEU|nr:GGDEF domain-containing protein [Longimycelium tulufanense]GGM83569.1 hypothetical protein GCM10012275_62710 [Longimycelium tulufanense]
MPQHSQPTIACEDPTSHTRPHCDAECGLVYRDAPDTQWCSACGQHYGYWKRGDRLTGLPDRWDWEASALTAFRQTRTNHDVLALLIIDLDQFKQINDEFGHLAGDTVLRGLASELRQSIPDHGLLGRYGDDEFLALLPHTGQNIALDVAQRTRDGVETMHVTASMTPGGAPVHVPRHTASIRITCYSPHRHWELADLLLDADTALREAKRSGGNSVCLARRGPRHTQTNFP